MKMIMEVQRKMENAKDTTYFEKITRELNILRKNGKHAKTSAKSDLICKSSPITNVNKNKIKI